MSSDFPKVRFDHATARMVPHAKVTADRVSDLYNGAGFAAHQHPDDGLDALALHIICATCHYLLGLPNVRGNPCHDSLTSQFESLRKHGEALRKQAEGECNAAEGN